MTPLIEQLAGEIATKAAKIGADAKALKDRNLIAAEAIHLLRQASVYQKTTWPDDEP